MKRYNMEYVCDDDGRDSSEMRESSYGDYVLYDDHVYEVDELRRQICDLENERTILLYELSSNRN